jgi:hypothetical protein
MNEPFARVEEEKQRGERDRDEEDENGRSDPKLGPTFTPEIPIASRIHAGFPPSFRSAGGLASSRVAGVPPFTKHFNPFSAFYRFAALHFHRCVTNL